MDWNRAIERNREALKRIVAMLVSLAGLADGRATLPRRLHRAVLGLLRPAEAAVRRLVMIVARGLTLPAPGPRITRRRRKARRAGPSGRAEADGRHPDQAAPAPPALPLLDPLPLWRPRAPTRTGVPRISVPSVTALFRVAPRIAPKPDDPIDAGRLALRLSALTRALDDLPREARRFARWMAAHNAALAAACEGRQPYRRRVWPLRPGRPPGQRKRRRHEVHDLLDETQYLAFLALRAPDTS